MFAGFDYLFALYIAVLPSSPSIFMIVDETIAISSDSALSSEAFMIVDETIEISIDTVDDTNPAIPIVRNTP